MFEPTRHSVDYLPIILTAVISAVASGVAVWLWMRSTLLLERGLLTDRMRALSDLTARYETLSSEAADLGRKLAASEASRNEERRAAEDRILELKQVQKAWLKDFDALSRKALDDNSKSFVGLAKSQFEQLMTKAGAQGAQQKLEMEKLVEPLSKSLDAVRTHLDSVEKQRTEAYSSLTEQVKGLSSAQALLQKEAGNLVNALRKPSVRGRWGEVQLRRVVELAGLVEYCDFTEQQTVQTDDGRLRPDMVVHLPGKRSIVVDAKTPLAAYLDAIEAETESQRVVGMQRHAAQIRDHVKKLGTKAYQDQLESTPDMVVLFLPGESFFYAALQEDPGLFEYGIGYNVVIATPMTLIALMRAVSYGWRQEQVAENARRIGALGQELYDRLCTMAETFGRVGSGLNTAVTNYNKAVGSLESRVLVSARRFKEMGSGSSRELPPLDSVKPHVRTPSAPELEASQTRLALSWDGGDQDLERLTS